MILAGRETEASTQVTGIRPGSTRFPRYDAAVLGFEGYWYPVMRSRELRGKPIALRLFGHDIMFVRSAGTAYALHDRCPHRGIPLSIGKTEFPGTVTCRYHGWTFEVKTGRLIAALTDGPDSPVCGKSGVRTYALAERLGIIWIYNGEGEPPPVERDIPQEMLRPNAVIEGRITTRPGDWRHAAENGFDEGHAKYLHRGALIMLFARMPGSSVVKVGPDDDPWITRKTVSVHFESEFPGLGTWPKARFWKRTKPGSRISIRMPGLLRVNRSNLLHFEWYVPTEIGRHRYLQFALQHKTGTRAALFRLYYWAWFRWVFHVLFNDQDASVVELMKTPPEQLYRPDISLIAWRHLCEQQTAGADEPAPQETAEAAYRQQEHEQFIVAP